VRVRRAASYEIEIGQFREQHSAASTSSGRRSIRAILSPPRRLSPRRRDDSVALFNDGICGRGSRASLSAVVFLARRGSGLLVRSNSAHRAAKWRPRTLCPSLMTTGCPAASAARRRGTARGGNVRPCGRGGLTFSGSAESQLALSTMSASSAPGIRGHVRNS